MQAQEHEGKALPYVTVTPEGYNPSRDYPVVVLLHGFGANMYDLAGLTPAISPTGYLYLCPNAPIGFDFGGGMIGFGWTHPGGFNDPDANRQAEEALDGFLKEVGESYRLTPGRVLLLGFSQGGMLAYRYGLPRPDLFAGVVALSAGVSNPDDLEKRLPLNRTQPIFIAHGQEDPVVSVESGRAANKRLEQWGYKQAVYHEYPGMGHEISEAVMADLSPWLRAVLPPLGGGLIVP
jgi:phospholipase/carboxylesterase